MAVVRSGLLRIDRDTDPRSWRPHPLVLSGAPTQRWHLVELANALTHERGLVTVSSVLPEDTGADRRISLEETIREYLRRRGIEAFVRLVAAPTPFEGGKRLVETYGFGNLVPNTIIVGDSEEPTRRDDYCRMIHSFHDARRNVLIFRELDEGGFGERKRIDIWWGGLERNGGLMLVLAYLLQTSSEWRDPEIRLTMVVDSEEAVPRVRENLEEMLSGIRIGSVRLRILPARGREFREILHESSGDADLVMMGMKEPDEAFRDYYERLQETTRGLPTTLFVLASEELAFAEILVEAAHQRGGGGS